MTLEAPPAGLPAHQRKVVASEDRAAPQRFPMTPDLAVTLATALFLVSFIGMELWLGGRWSGAIERPTSPRPLPDSSLWAALHLVVAWGLLLFIAVLPVVVLRLLQSAPRAIRLDAQGLWLERLATDPTCTGWTDIAHVEAGPPLCIPSMFARHTDPWAFAITGVLTLAGVGTVHCWATRVGTPTVLVHRTRGEPMLLGVDDAEALLREAARLDVKPATAWETPRRAAGWRSAA
jgi:hypothetical protein